MLDTLPHILQKAFAFTPNRNQLRDLKRLIFEILRRENISLENLIDYLKDDKKISKHSGRNVFFAIKDILTLRRFPLTAQTEKIDCQKIFLPQLHQPLTDNWRVQPLFKPLKVFVENEVKNTDLVNNFKIHFPDVETEEINYYSEYLKGNKFQISELKKPLVFIVKEKWDFIKACPCTPHHMCCGYWILNLGFGCPFDCSYCFLQHYTNFPGLILPANFNDFFEQFDAFYKKLQHPVRIGTGEFCDSLALDHITHYSQKLIPYLKNKEKILFEFKTKSDQITNILTISSSSNIVISWSLNPPSLIQTEESGVASLERRLHAAKKIQEKGYKIGFHFDPIIHSQNWEAEYSSLIQTLYEHVKPPFAWISLGTLRSHRELKTIVEMRFPNSNIFYGELLIGEDKKLRYPLFLRKKIYKNMIQWIKQYDSKTPVYLCMEDKNIWDLLDKKYATTHEIENYILHDD